MAVLAFVQRKSERCAGVDVVSRIKLKCCPQWLRDFHEQRKYLRFYDLAEDTPQQGFDYRYFVLKDERGEMFAVQSLFIGASSWPRSLLIFAGAPASSLSKANEGAISEQLGSS
jgi:hypothetical protein